MKDVDFYGPADRMIREMDREIVRDFGKLKLAKFDELHITQAVTRVYREQLRKARNRYYEMAAEAFLLGLWLCGISGKKAHETADRVITMAWIDRILTEVDPVARCRFDTETERKAQKLAETLTAIALTAESLQEAETGTGKGAGGGKRKPTGLGAGVEIDRAMRSWSKQIGQFAIDITDAAVAEAYDEAGVPQVMWLTERDQRVCSDCHQLDGKVFPLDSVPVKPHYNCRCRIVPAGREEADK